MNPPETGRRVLGVRLPIALGSGVAGVLAIAIAAVLVIGGGGSGGSGVQAGAVHVQPAATKANETSTAAPSRTAPPSATPEPTPELEAAADTGQGDEENLPSARSEPSTDVTATAPEPTTAPAAPPPPPAPPAPPAAPPPAGTLAGLRVYSNGDSTSYFMSASVLATAVSMGGVQVQAAPEYQISSGLINSGYFDWYGYMASEMAAYTPDVVVFMVGANDAHPGMDLGLYRQRVGQMMDQLQGRRLIWVGQPNMARADLSAAIPGMNQVFAEEAAKRPWVRYVDTWSLTSDGAGNFTPYLPDGSLARADDGVHFTASGGAYLAQAVIAAILGG